MDSAQSILDSTRIDQCLEFFGEIEFEEALRKENKETSILDTEQLDRLRLCTKLLVNIQSNLRELEEGSLEIRYNQLEGLVKFIGFLESAGEGDRLGYFRQPTGAGKTILMAIVAKLCSVKSLFLVPRNNLIEQTIDALKKVGFSDDDIGVVGDGRFQPGKLMTICTYQSLPKLMKGRKHTYEMMLCDEAHRGLGDRTNKHLSTVADESIDDSELTFADVEKYIPKQALRLGFTATPDLLKKSVDKYFKKLIHSVTFAELVRSKILVKFKLVHTEGTVYDDDMENGEINQKMETKILEREKIYAKLVHKYLETTEKLGKKLRTAVFCSSIAECDKFLLEAEKEDLRCAIVTSRESAKNPKALEEAEDAMMRGEIDFIVTVDKLGEGWDFPPLEAVILARATLSPVKIIQPIGRAARTYTDSSGVEKQASYVFETEWERKSARSEKEAISSDDVIDSDPEIEENGGSHDDDDVKIPGNKGKRKPLNVAQALVRLGEVDIAEICEGIDGEPLQYEAYQKAPEGWVFRNALAESLNVDITTIDSTSHALLASQPDGYEIKIFLTHNNVPRLCYSPAFVSAIRVAVNERVVEAPKGWMTEQEIQSKLGVSRNFIVSSIAAIVEKNPDWTKKFASKKRALLIAFYSPGVLELIEKSLSERPKLAPPGWMTRGKLADELKTKSEKIEEIIAPYRQTNDTYFREYIDARNRASEYLSPTLIAIVRAVLNTESELPEDYSPEIIEIIRGLTVVKSEKLEEAPEGWMTVNTFCVQSKMAEETFKRIAVSLQGTSPDYQVKRFLGARNIPRDFYSPQFIKAITAARELKSHDAPDGWLTKKDIADTLDISEDNVSKKIASISPQFPDGVKKYKNRSGWESDYYSPEIVAALTTQVKARPELAPAGWKTKAGFAVSSGVTRFQIEKFAEPLRAEHPEWFKMYLDEKKRSFEHYSPELIAIVREKLGK